MKSYNDDIPSTEQVTKNQDKIERLIRITLCSSLFNTIANIIVLACIAYVIYRVN